MATVRRLRRPPPCLPVSKQRSQFWWGEHDVWSRRQPRRCPCCKVQHNVEKKKGHAGPALKEWICVGDALLEANDVPQSGEVSSNNSWVTSGSQCCEAKVEEVQPPPNLKRLEVCTSSSCGHFGKLLAQQTTCAMPRPLSVQRSEQFPFLCTSWQVPSPWPHARIPATEELAASQQRRYLVTKPWGLPVQRLNPLSIPGLWPNTLERKMQEPACCFPEQMVPPMLLHHVLPR